MQHTEELKTVLYDSHMASGGKIVPFGGFLMPIQYPLGILKEHLAVREKAGLFDVSHMGEFFVSGSDALANIQNLLCNDFSNMVDGQVRYSPMCNEKGGIVDDLLVYKLADNEYMIVVNASNIAKDFAWMNAHLSGELTLVNRSSEIGLIALQGPNALAILKTLTAEENIPEKYYSFKNNVAIGSVKGMISRTGYTGEDGFEFYVDTKDTIALWSEIIEKGKDFGLALCGLGARDTLRLEAAMPLYGHEMTDDISALESGLKMFVKMDKENFIGKQALLDRISTKKRVGIEVTGKGIAREGSDILIGGNVVGFVSSGTMCPFINKACAMGFVPVDTALGQVVELDIRGRKVEGKIVKLPFYKRAK